ncbi:hypothetical protein FTUN_4476 [Frigoriglobus tundricola]|uniref:Uncharacterized protein n=1 Tax=Frigoriglobus tundricola TaxID=2774151 RepID=A0A6M5YU20_9BACT|nr:hypothetical protein FTUN_4476 [Frigoriglobus tundricola]
MECGRAVYGNRDRNPIGSGRRIRIVCGTYKENEPILKLRKYT